MIGHDAAAMRSLAAIALCGLAALLTGCGGGEAVRPAANGTRVTPIASAAANPAQDGPPAANEIPADLVQVPDAVPQVEPRSSSGNPDSYEVYGDHYVVLKDARGYKERGYASWYGKKFHGKRTSSGEPYDMFKMTAAHKTLPIPCYARVTNLDNDRSVVVRINDRGPFHSGRIIDLSYTAAVKLGSLGKGSIPVEVEAIDPSMPTPTTLYAGTPKPLPAPPQAPAAAALPPPRPAAAPAMVAQAPPPSAPALPRPAPAAAAAAQPVVALALAPTLSSAASARPAPPPAVGRPAPQPVELPPPPAAAPVASVAVAPAPAAPAAAAPVVSVPARASTPLARFLQAGLFNDPINAVTLREQLNGLGISNVLLKNDMRNGNSVSRVLIGPFLDSDMLSEVRRRLSELQMPAVPVLE